MKEGDDKGYCATCYDRYVLITLESGASMCRLCDTTKCLTCVKTMVPGTEYLECSSCLVQ